MASLLGACVRGLRCDLSSFVCFITISVDFFGYYIWYTCARDLASGAPLRVAVNVGGRGGADMGYL